MSLHTDCLRIVNDLLEAARPDGCELPARARRCDEDSWGGAIWGIAWVRIVYFHPRSCDPAHWSAYIERADGLRALAFSDDGPAAAAEEAKAKLEAKL
jgi:hypothetical protein